MAHSMPPESKQCFADRSYRSNGSSSFTMEPIDKLAEQITDSDFHH